MLELLHRLQEFHDRIPVRDFLGKDIAAAQGTEITAASWFFACIFLIVAATILRSFFL